MEKILAALKDIHGVEGSFVMNVNGDLVCRHMPTIFADEIFPELGRRLLNIYSTFDLQVSQFDDLLLKFEGYWLYIRRAAHGFLSILTTESVNYPALKMASNLALGQINAQIQNVKPLPIAPAGTVSSPTVSAPAAAPVAAPAPMALPDPKPAPVAAPKPSVPLHRRFFRGQPVD
jgi:predicted regulator of Ras-like GTPase activity (Roadblock/LC7/MglB family)